MKQPPDPPKTLQLGQKMLKSTKSYQNYGVYSTSYG